MTVERPLSPYRVLEIGTGAASICGRLFADLGAEVVKLESGEGDPLRRQPPLIDGTGISFLWANANKKPASADLTDSSVQASIRESLRGFDVLIDGEQPGWLSAHGLDPAELRDVYPHLIIASVSHFGQAGPYQDWVGSPLVDYALGGSLLKSGLSDKAPTAPPYMLPNAIGGVAAAMATMAALSNRQRTGVGDWIDCSTVEAIQSQNDWAAVGHSNTGAPTIRSGAGPVFRIYRAPDGWVRVINLSAKQWTATKTWLGNPSEVEGPEWNNPLFRAANPETMDLVFERHFEGHSRTDLYHDGQRHGVGIVPIYSPDEVMRDDHFDARGTFVPFPLPEGSSAQAPGGFVRMAGSPPAEPAPAPRLTGGLSALHGEPVHTSAPTGDSEVPPLTGRSGGRSRFRSGSP